MSSMTEMHGADGVMVMMTMIEVITIDTDTINFLYTKN